MLIDQTSLVYRDFCCQYREFLLTRLPHYSLPMLGLGIGKQLSQHKEIISEIEVQDRMRFFDE